MGTKRDKLTGRTDTLGRPIKESSNKNPNNRVGNAPRLDALSDFTLEQPHDQYSHLTNTEAREMLSTVEDPHDAQHDALRTHIYNTSSNENWASATAETVHRDASQPDGGATVNLGAGKSITKGFAYSPYEERSEKVHVSELTPEHITSFVERNKDLLDQEGNNLGIWHDPHDGQVYLDVSVVVDDAAEARLGCEDNDQIAFFDMQTFDSVTVDQNATSGGA